MEERFERGADAGGERIAFGGAFFSGGDFDGIADFDGGVDAEVRAGFVGEVFLEAFDGFEEAFGGGVFEVAARVAVELLGEVEIGEGTPMIGGIGISGDDFGDDGGAEALDAGNGAAVVAGGCPAVFERGEDAVFEGVEALGDGAGAGRAEVFGFLEAEEGGADFFDAVLEGKVGLGLPGEAFLDVGDDREDGFFRVALVEVANEDGVDDDPAVFLLLRGGAGDEGGAVHEFGEAVVGTGDDSFGEDDERVAGFGEEVGGAFERLAVEAFAVDAEAADAREEEALEAVHHENVPARDDVEGTAGLCGEGVHDHGIAGAAVVRRDHDTVAGIERGAEFFNTVALDAGDAVVFPEEMGEKGAEEAVPERAVPRWDELVRLGDDDGLHGSEGVSGIALAPGGDPEAWEKDEENGAQRGGDEDRQDEVEIVVKEDRGQKDGGCPDEEIETRGEIVEAMGGGAVDRGGEAEIDQERNGEKESGGKRGDEIASEAEIEVDREDAEPRKDGAVVVHGFSGGGFDEAGIQ